VMNSVLVARLIHPLDFPSIVYSRLFQGRLAFGCRRGAMQ